MARILIIAGQHDPHVSSVVKHLDARGVDHALVNFETLVETGVAFDPERDAFSLAGQEIADCSAVWYRRPRPIQHKTLSSAHLSFARQEFRQAVLGPLLALPLHWVSRPTAIDTASFKPLQYHVAKHRFGLAIPRTLITSDPEQARAFIQTLGADNCIAKPLGRPVIDYGDKLTYFFTNRLNQDALNDIGLVRYGPCIFQNFIRKSFEVRATVIGDQVFAAKLATEGVAKAEVDWRRATLDDLPHEPIAVPDPIARACVDMCRHFDLRFGAFDFIVDREGVWYFLEVNPNGQWLWIEHMAGWPLSAAMADELTRNP